MSNALHKKVHYQRTRCRKCGSKDMMNKAEYGLVCAKCGWQYKGSVNPKRGNVEGDTE